MCSVSFGIHFSMNFCRNLNKAEIRIIQHPFHHVLGYINIQPRELQQKKTKTYFYIPPPKKKTTQSIKSVIHSPFIILNLVKRFNKVQIMLYLDTETIIN